MFTVTKRMEIAGAHSLNLPYDSPCAKLHGHNWIIEVEVSAEELNKEGMVIDFTEISRIVKQLDHNMLSELKCPHCLLLITSGILPDDTNPTAENIAKYLYIKLMARLLMLYQTDDSHVSTQVTKVTVQESEGNTACYIP